MLGVCATPVSRLWHTADSALLKSTDSVVCARSYDKVIIKVFPFGYMVWQPGVCVCVCLKWGRMAPTEAPGGAITILWGELNFQTPRYYHRKFHGKPRRKGSPVRRKVEARDIFVPYVQVCILDAGRALSWFNGIFNHVNKQPLYKFSFGLRVAAKRTRREKQTCKLTMALTRKPR